MELEDWQLNQYLQEVVHQAQAAQVNGLHYDMALKQPPELILHFAFPAVQGILTAAGQVAQLLWVNHGTDKPRTYGHLSDDEWETLRTVAKTRAKWLRKVLGVTDDSPIKSRAVRNSFEHFDARLDEVIVAGASKGSWRIIDRMMMPSQVTLVEGVEKTEYLRFIASDTLEVSILNDKVSLIAVRDELMRMQQLAEQRLEQTRFPRGQ